MTKLSQNNIQADGIGDVFEDLQSQGRNSSVALGTQDTYQDRAPRLNGSTRTGQQPAGSTIQFNDFRSSVKFESGLTSYTVGSGKSSTTHTVVGWATAGGMQGATNGASSTQIGTLYDGSTIYTSSPKPFDELNSGFDGNKWLCAIVVDSYNTGLLGNNFADLYICFEGGGAQTGDTDWTNVTFKQDGLSNTQFIDYRQGGVNVQLARTAANSVISQQSRIAYKYAISGGLNTYISRYFETGGDTHGSTNFWQFT